MFAFLRRRRTATLAAVTFCDACAQVCTAECRAAAHYDRIRTAALTHVIR
ncbi:hypothetical protein [Spirilliplanes yamanashiensis]|uniref:Uncharacterized protein n=1 Tax=Spirilliplanes yamanashiensis TaxID=42233 RepID=A0A8J3YEH9_9ACTN|nr:hypothetical protein [Spirilliplanes yamanashiensis]MDP9818383.1 hypothetical protein [Spirilliplanes yamanashiensis]GIJ06604.1 hypothetical protein Sya03_59560 [Spirilliplanes yamanashiensis]